MMRLDLVGEMCSNDKSKLVALKGKEEDNQDETAEEKVL